MPCTPLVVVAAANPLGSTAATSTTTSTLRAFSRTLFSFESLLLGYLLFFAVLGAAIALGLFFTVLDECDEADEYDAACQYYEKGRDASGRGRRWIPVVVLDERAFANTHSHPKSQRGKEGPERPHH